jgi:hypothetical protein
VAHQSHRRHHRDEIVPGRADSSVAPYNIDALWAKLIELVPDAQRTPVAHAGRHQGRRGMGCHLAAGGQRRPRRQGHFSDAEHDTMTQMSKPKNGSSQTNEKRPERERSAVVTARNGEPAATALADYAPWARIELQPATHQRRREELAFTLIGHSWWPPPLCSRGHSPARSLTTPSRGNW